MENNNNNNSSQLRNKYIIYKNDLKYRDSRNLDINKIDWDQNNIKHLYDINHDSLEYRYKEYKKNNIDFDLEGMNLTQLPTIILTQPEKFINLKHLFMSQNNLSGELDLTQLINLELVDVDNNKLVNIKLPNNIQEISAKYNCLESVPRLPNAIRVRLSHNNINNLNNLNHRVNILELDNNKINSLDLFDYNNLQHLAIFNNPLTKINLSPSVTYVDLSETKITNIDNLYNISHLVANDCKNLIELPKSKIIKNIELVNTPVDKLYYYDNYELILIQLNLTKNISSKYKTSGANMQIRKNILLVISRGVEINE
jgi:hypothetical protein